jgi:MerR family copper efflux transcriptional regulator
MTINEAAQVTGWSARMLRYIERSGLVAPARSQSGYRVYGISDVVRLHELKELVGRFALGLSDVAFAARLAASPDLRESVDGWLGNEQGTTEDLSPPCRLLREEDGHERLLAGTSPKSTQALLMERR